MMDNYKNSNNCKIPCAKTLTNEISQMADHVRADIINSLSGNEIAITIGFDV